MRRNFNYRSTLGQPKFRTGNVIGEFTVEDYLGHSTVHPRKVTILSKEHHWYACRCSCGLLGVRTQ